MKILYRSKALDDLEWFNFYYGSVFSGWFSKAIKSFESTEKILSDNPYIGQSFHKWTRKLRITSTPFSYIYIVEEGYIKILRVLDGRNRWK